MKHLTINWRTTLIGLALTGAGLYTGITAKADWTQSSVIIGTGLGMLLAKDAHTGRAES